MKRQVTRHTHKITAIVLTLAIVIILVGGVVAIAWAQHLEGPGRPQHQENVRDNEDELFWTLQLM
ncbi:MAG: hypothetical protein SPD11_02905 [Sphaerochaetaceae bacterium]|nr:hypothetical protein [Sphaerochaetaceae bacterium]